MSEWEQSGKFVEPSSFGEVLAAKPAEAEADYESAHRQRTNGQRHSSGSEERPKARDLSARQPERRKRIPFSELVASHPKLREPVIDGVLRQGETCNVIASPKIRKTFLVHGICWSVAYGLPWMGHATKQGKVLLIDNELHAETLAERLDRTAHAMEIPHDHRTGLDIVCMRGMSSPINQLDQFFDDIEPGEYVLVVLDALYRSIPIGMSENDHADMIAVYNFLDRMAASWGSAFIVVHHASKGSQGEKSVTDVGSGAGIISRAADTHLILRPHEQEGHIVMESVVRSFPPMEAVSIKFEYPLWLPTTLEPEVKGRTRVASDAQKKLDREAMAEMLQYVPSDGKPIQQGTLFERACVGGFSRSKRIADLLVKYGEVERRHIKRKGGNEKETFYRLAASNSESQL